MAEAVAMMAARTRTAIFMITMGGESEALSVPGAKLLMDIHMFLSLQICAAVECPTDAASKKILRFKIAGSEVAPRASCLHSKKS
jgi:hypothetical protein